MPSVSAKQHRTMEAAAHNPAFAKKVGIPKKVASDFAKADEARAKKRKASGKALYPSSKDPQDGT